VATTIRTYRDGALVDTEVDADDGSFAVTVDTTGWTMGTYNITCTAQKAGESESAASNALSLQVIVTTASPTSVSVPSTGTAGSNFTVTATAPA
jgi:hypothetical protein